MSFCKYLISVIFTFCLFPNVWPSCVLKDGNYDLSPLDLPGGWLVAGLKNNESLTHYVINVCSAVNSTSSENAGCPNSAVCQVSGNESTSFGDSLKSEKDYSIAIHTRNGFSLYLLTKTPCEEKGVYRSTINFACGPNLGVPQLILRSKCQVNFHWKTSAACPTKPKSNQVPCYVLDTQGEIRDLSYLIKYTGGHFVNTPKPAIDFVINVCSDILPDNDTRNCPANSAACRIIGSESLIFGKPQSGLQYTQEGLLLTYKTTDIYPSYPAGCSLEPKTTILFKCPERGYSQPPKVISDLNCQYEVDWETEYACPESSLKSNIKTCQFNTEPHGVEIDLSPLRQNPVYIVHSNSSNLTTFALSVCGGLENYPCGNKQRWKSISVCMTNSNNDSVVVGTTSGTRFMYADEEVILIYPKGETCDIGMEHSTKINFICDQLATNNGSGKPMHLYSDHCIHFFEWRTKHACLRHPLDTPCSVTFEKKKISLQKLLLVQGEAWEAVDRRSVPNAGNAEYYINVCGQVSSLSNLSNCGEGSSACVLHTNGSFISLGNFTSPPVYDAISKSVKLEYTGGSPCSSGKLWKSTIDFICRPGHMNSEPVLTKIDENECLYKFEWLTAEACPEAMIEGSDCKVYDNNLGINYDLNPLKSKVYEVNTGIYTFYMGVCEPVTDSPCSKNRNSTENVGVCQVDQLHKSSWKTGEPSSHLSYMDGVVNLTYLSGDPYNDVNKTSRMTIIIFICDSKAGDGNPSFVEEINFAYVFHWYTDLVCPNIFTFPAAATSECLAHDPHSLLIYDLSGLSTSKNNWMSIVSEDDKELQIYLNICRSLTQPSLCDSNAAACVVEVKDGVEKVFISNIGRVTGPPVLEGPGHLSLTYTNGSSCTAYGKNITYSTVIHFVCGERMSKSGLTFLNKLGACEYTFLWTTKAACPTANLLAKESCQLTDPDSGFTFDLTSLHMQNKPYEIETTNATYQFNVCGRIVEGCSTSDGNSPSANVSVCEVDKDGNSLSHIALADSYTLSYSVGQDLTLTYKYNGTSSEQEVVIKFPCYDGVSDPKPKFVNYEDGHYMFEMRTHLTCIANPVSCNVFDGKGNEYDLSPLAKFNGENWEVTDSRPENVHVRYYINFCRPLNKVPYYMCPGGTSSACQTSILERESTGHDLGSQMSPPTVSDKGTVVIRFINGSLCHNGQFQRSTTINLFCSASEGELTFIGETPECEYVFSMDSPAACPIQSTRGNGCMVKDPVYGYMFDLNPLKSKNNNYNLTVGEYEYFFNVCDKLNGLHEQCINSSACQTKPSDPKFSFSLGKPNDNPVYRNGLITLEYNSGSSNCHGKYNRSTILTFTCHHEHEDRDGPKFIAEAGDCSYSFEWPTVHACPPFDVIECSVVDKNGIYYDFSRLSLPDDNYYVKNPFSETKTFVINLCRSIVHTSNSLCPYTAASCLMDDVASNEPINLGRVSQSPYMDYDKIKINYTSGDPCNDEKTSSSRFWQTIVEFSCDPHKVESEPLFVGKDDCTYYFDWPTAYACPTKPVKNAGNCTVQDPNTGFLYNLTALKDHGVFRTQGGNHQYYVNVCGNSRNPCGNDTAVCQEDITGKKTWKAGKPNNNLLFRGGILYLNYSNGDLCHGDRFQRNTLIEFHCGLGIGEPKFMYESHDCTYFFTWKTELACQTSMHCAIKNGSQYIDLTSLSETYHTASSSVLNDDASYFISVCNSLPNFVGGHFCPPESGICRVSRHQNSSSTFTQSLGRSDHLSIIDFMGFATLLYTNGSTCETNTAEKNRARIIFTCDSEAGIGEPVLIEKKPEDCFYLFEWRTSIVCPEKPIYEGLMSCNYTDLSKGIHFDLSPLQKSDEPYKVNDDKSGGHFLLKVCSPLNYGDDPNCKDAGICAPGPNLSQNYGQAKSQQFAYDGQRLRLTFFEGDDCPSGLNGKRTSDIFFVCDPAVRHGAPVLHKKYSCLAVFLWRTSLVCQNMQKQCSFEVGGNHYDFNLLSSLSHNWNVTNGQNTYWINLCRGIQQTPATLDCSPTSAVCMKDHNDIHMTLGTVQTMEVKPINSTDLLLTFQSGDKRACSNIHSNTSLTPVTRLFMHCGTSLGHPKMFSGPDSQCFYDFFWESSLACADRAEQVLVEKDGIIKDQRFGYTVNISGILNSTFNATGSSGFDEYVYEINLSGVYQNPTQNVCAKAAICQVQPASNFSRDIGSIETRTFIVRGSELHLTFLSTTKKCGKNNNKNVTTIINLQCVSSAGIGNPRFMYESGDCDYVFVWDTIAVCPEFDRKKPDNDSRGNHPNPNPYTGGAQSSHKAEIIIGVMVAVLVFMVIAFILVKPERRAHVAHRFRTLFGGVDLPYFRYKRCNGERLVLVDASQPDPYDDERDVEMLT